VTTPEAPAPAGSRPGGRDLALDSLRGVAIVLVLAAHAHLWHADQLGVTGVTVFFVLSGFLITTVLVREQYTTGRLSLGRFYARRALRLLPALLLMLVLMSFAATTTWSAWWRSALASALYVGNWVRVADPTGFHPALIHTWTLAVEEHYYLLWPLVLVLLRRRGRGFLLALVLLAAASVALRSALWPSWHAQLGSDTNAYGLLLGSALALVRPRRDLRAGVLGAALLVLAVALPSVATGPVAAVAALCLVSGPVPTWPVLVGAGRISYGLYLWHIPVMSTVILVAQPEWVRALALYPVAVLLALVSYRFVETPFLRLKDRRFAARTGERGPVEANPPTAPIPA